MSALLALLNDLPEEAVWRLEEICCGFEQCWQEGQRPSPEDFLAGTDGALRLAVLHELLRLEVHYRRQAGEEPAAQDYAMRFPEATGFLSEMFPGFHEGCESPELGPENTVHDADRTGPHIVDMNSSEWDKPADTDGAPQASRFRVRWKHAEGALGEVFVAEDLELHREVALKEIKRENTCHEQSRVRFVLEAEITGNLEHPGIVPVYGLGKYADGRPYYAMRFIRGETLEKAIKRFHSQAGVRFDSLEFRQLLGRHVAVCQAIAYAHNRGVLHRDIKPGNIMLGKFGETLVVDWGLAKVLNQASRERQSSEQGPSEEGPLRPSVDGLQATAGVCGTPAFMSPEQAAGKVEELGPATDVYSLGATLYALLTSCAPFKGPVVEVVRKVERGEWLPPRQVNNSVPAALDAICRKAMALRPEDRYGSALALAEDVEHWLADEPVVAFPEPAGARLRRWVRKRPRRVTAAVVLLLAAVVGLTLGTVLLEQRNREVRENLDMVEKQASYFTREVNEDLLMNEPGMQPLRQRILLRVLEDYERFLKKRPNDPRARQHMAGAKRQLGELFLQTDSLRMDEARALANQAVEAYEGLLQVASADRELRFGLARALILLADLAIQLSESGKGKTEVDRSIQLLEGLKSEEPGNGEYLITLARCYDLRATAEGQQGDVESGLADNKRVLEVLVEEAPELLLAGTPLDQSMFYHPTNQAFGSSLRAPAAPRSGLVWGAGRQWCDLPWPHLLLLGRGCTNQGILLSMSGRNGAAARVLAQAITIHRMLLERRSRAGQFRHGLALALLHAGRVQVELGMPGRAEVALREALKMTHQLVQDDPLVKHYRTTRFLITGYLGEALFRQGRTVAAAGLLRESDKDGAEVRGGSRNNPGLRGQHARLFHVLGCLELESGNLDRGLDIFLKANEKLAQVLRETPGDRRLGSTWLANREALAQCRFQKEELSRAGWIAEQQDILDRRKNLVGRGPPSPRFQGEVAGSASALANLLLEAGRPAEALACVDGVLPDHEKIVQTEQDRVKMAAKEQQEGEPVPVNPRDIHSLHLFMRKMPIIPDNSLHRQWAMLLVRKGAALARVGRGAEAVATIRKAISISRGLLLGRSPFRRPSPSLSSRWAEVSEWFMRVEPCYFYDLTCHLALASTLPGKNNRPNAADEAVRTLRYAIVSGFDNPHKLRTDPALDSLRKRDDFQELVHELEVQGQERKGNP